MIHLDKFHKFQKKLYLEYYGKFHWNQIILLIKEFIQETEGTVDTDMAKVQLAQWFLFMNEFEKMNVILQDLLVSFDEHVIASVYHHYVLYYAGWLNPAIDLKKAVQYALKAKMAYDKASNTNEEWEKYTALTNKIFMDFVLEKDLEKKMYLIDEVRSLTEKVPEYGYQWRMYREIIFGQVFEQNGDFEQAQNSYELLVHYFQDTDFSVFGYNSLALLSAFKGNLDQAEEYIEKGLKLAHDGGNYFLLHAIMVTSAYLKELKSDYSQSEMIRVEIIGLLDKQNKELLSFKQRYALFAFYIRMFRLINEREYLEKAITTKKQLDRLANPLDITMSRLLKLATAFLYKNGSLKERAQAIDLFEEILGYYPEGMDRFYQMTNRSIELKLNLVELYFDDLERDKFQRTKEKIDTLMEEIEKSPLMRNPITIAEYSNYQILVAKYYFYVESNVQHSFQILDSLNKEAEKYNIQKVRQQINSEIQFLESEVTKWSNLPLSVQERVKKSNISAYMKEAVNMVKRDTI